MQPVNHPPSREQLLYWLHEASEIEHHLMCCYLYAAFSLKREDPRWTAAQREAVGRWREAILSVVFDEMAHLALVGNLAASLGGGAHMNRPPFPVDAGPYPAGFVIRLAPFSAATIDHFKFLERPSDEAIADAAGFTPSRDYRRGVPEGRLSPGPRDYSTVGELYQVLADSLRACVAAQGEKAVFIGDPALQVDAGLAPLQGVVAVTDLSSALQAVETIVTQGEGAGDEAADSHFSRFCRIADELAQMTAEDASFEPAWQAATNPVMNAPIHSADQRVHISAPRIVRWLDIGNAMYTTSLRCLLQGFGATDRRSKATWLAASFALMRGVVPVGQGLAARPATQEADGPHAGLTFTPLRSLARLPESSAAAWVAERLGQLRERALALPLELVAGESAATWQAVIDLLAGQQAALLRLAAQALPGPGAAPGAAASATPAASMPASAPASASTSPSAPAPAAAKQEAPAAPAPEAPRVELAKGRTVSVLFEARRCIHSRHCVLDAPSVFKANTPGEWIFPDSVPAETVMGVAHNCPSGAIRYQRHDGGPEEAAPPVNQLRIRENGPYALHAAMSLAQSLAPAAAPAAEGQDAHFDGYRATLCRCGLSGNKPFCDGSHAGGGFVATGEPASGVVDPLAQRDGPLAVTPLKNGPLRVQGNLEICAGTGRTVARVTEAKLCRCGQSQNKPFCDMSHLAAGFSAPGA